MPVKATTFAEYLATFPACSVNTVMQVGHNTLRLMATGMEDRAPSADEHALMERLLTEALDAGALGLSSGPFTPPGAYASPDELARLVRLLAQDRLTARQHGRDGEAAVADDFGRHALAHLAVSRRGEGQREVRVCLDVDEPGGDDEPAGVDHAVGGALVARRDRHDAAAADRDIGRDRRGTGAGEHLSTAYDDVRRGSGQRLSGPGQGYGAYASSTGRTPTEKGPTTGPLPATVVRRRTRRYRE
jgi:hypothetical protein